MAKEKKGSHYEMVLEDRHLLGVFFAVVLLCALFFTLGFVLGRNQVAKIVPAGPAPKPAAAQPAPAPGDLSFYDRVEGKQPPESVPASPPPKAESKPAGAAPAKPVSPPATRTPSPTPTPTSPAPAASPSIYLQVAAVTQESDAKRLAGELRKLGFPTVIVPPRGDAFYRVQVGPFDNAELAAAAEQRLEAQGFRQIIKR